MRIVRGAVTAVGFGVLGLLGLVELVLRSRDAHVDPGPAPGAGDVDRVSGTSTPSMSPAVSRLRVVVGVIGVAVAVYGLYLVVRALPATGYLALAIWLAAAVVGHDAVLVPVVSVLRGTVLRVGRRLPNASLTLIEGALVVGGVLSLVAVPEIWAQHLGPLNPSVLPGAYGRALLVTWLTLAVASVAVAVGSLRRRAHPIEPTPSA